MDLLITLGADPHTWSVATEFLVPKDLKGLSLTLGNIAAFRGPLVLSTYLDALKTSGHDVEVSIDENDGGDEIF